VLRRHAAIGCAAAILLVLALLPFEEIGDVAGLKRALLLFAIEIPLFALARSHTHVLVGLGRYRARAAAGALRWTSRLALSVAFVAGGLGVDGAILGAVISTALELVAARIAVRPAFALAADAGLSRRLMQLSAPLFLHGLSLQLFLRLGLLVLVPLGASTASAGVYGAADSLLRLRRVLGQSLTPLLLGALAGMKRDGDTGGARRLGEQALRLALLAAIPVGAVAGAAAPLMAWLFGADFAAGGRTLALLVWGAPAFLVISVASAILIAAGRAAATAALTVPVVPIALAAYAIVVPRFGIAGAAAVTSAFALLAAAAFVLATRRLAEVAPPLASFARVAVATAAAFGAAHAGAGAGLHPLLLLPLAATAGVVALALLGEVRPGEILALRRALRKRRSAPEGGSRAEAATLDDLG